MNENNSASAVKRIVSWVKTHKIIAICILASVVLVVIMLIALTTIIGRIQNVAQIDTEGSIPSDTSKPTEQTTEPSHPGLDETLASINKNLSPYDIRVTLSPEKDPYATWTELSAEDSENLKTFATYLTSQFNKYPKDLVKNSELKKVALIKGLQVSGSARAATPSPSTDSVIYDINSMNANGADYAQQNISHEYWHYIDYTLESSYDYQDTKWSVCNPQGFSYGSGGASAYGDPNYTGAFHPTNGFITQYSQYAIEEDRAEMFGWLIYQPSKVKELNDAGLTCKTDRLTTIVRKLSPKMSF